MIVALIVPAGDGYLSVRFKPSGDSFALLREVYARMLAEEQRVRAAGGREDAAMDAALAALYGSGDDSSKRPRRAGLGASSPNVARWLGDIRKYFPSSVVQVMQQDALAKFNLRELLLEPEMLEAVQPDVKLVASLISLASVIPAETKETARLVVRRVVDELLKRLEEPLRSAVSG
jgi:hypothetical protein